MAVATAGTVIGVELVAEAHYPPGTDLAAAIAEQQQLGNEFVGASSSDKGVVITVHRETHLI